MKNLNKLFALLFLVLLISSFFYLRFTWNNNIKKEEARILLLAETAAIGLDGEMIKELSGQPEDKDTLAFSSLKKRLEQYKNLENDISFIYLYTKKNEQLFFMADAEMELSPNYSPPGQLYDEAADYYYQPFKNKNSLVTSPVSDRWGTWITALAPIFNDQGEVRAVLGVDIDAKNWSAKLISLITLPFIIIITILSINLVLIFTTYPQHRVGSRKIALKNTFPFFVTIILAIIIVPTFIFWQWEDNNIRELAYNSINQSRNTIEDILDQQKINLSIAAQAIANNKEVKEKLIENDTAGLLSDWQASFWQMYDTGELTHLYFFDQNRICLLRVHNPEKKGDLINRFTAVQAELNKKTSTGLEIGPLGTFTLRVVEPIFLENQIIGYVELGKEIEDVMNLINKQTGNHLVVNIDKKHLNQENWEKGMLMLNRQANWDHFTDKVIIYNSIDIPENIWPLLNNKADLFFNDRNWTVASYPKIDASGQIVGEIIILHDNTHSKESLLNTLTIVGGSSLMLLILLLSATYIILRRTDEIIISQKKSLEKSNYRFNQLAEKSRTFIWEIDTNTTYTYISPQVQKIIGYKPEEIIGKKTVIDFHPKEGRKEFKKSVLNIINNKEEITSLENPILDKNGNIVWVLSAGAPILDKKGKLLGYRGSDTDISALKKAESVLTKTKEKFETMVSNIPEIVYRCLPDKNWTMLYISQMIKDVSGYPVTDFINNKIRSYESIIHPDDRSYVENAIHQALAKQKAWEIEYRVIDRRKKIKWVSEKGRGIFDNNKIIFLDGVIYDISYRKKIEEQLLSVNKDLEKFKLAVENASDHIVITDADGLCLYGNKTVEKITGFSLKEILGKKVGTKDNWGGLMSKEVYKKLWRTIKVDKKTFVGDVENKRKNGEKYTAKASISPILDEKKRVIFFIGIERDISKEKAIDKAKSEFVSLASHQLRTPLSTINWYAEMLLAGDAGKLNKEQKEYLTEVYKGNQRMVDLVNALLNVSRIELGTLAVDPKPTNLIDQAESVLNEIKPLITKKKLTVVKNFEKNIPEIKLDSNLMRIVWQNLLSNALKYTPEKGKIKIKISKDKKQVNIEVADTGMGIPKNQQGKIFSKLFRADNVRQTETDGTGLGLYIVKAIIDQFAGKIWFKSQENKGTTFYATIPLKGAKAKTGTKGLENTR